MSADWTNEEAILRDLAIVQGNVPVENVETVSSNEKPPSIRIVEETEEEFLQKYATDGNTNVCVTGTQVKPDFDLIQEMLEMVRDIRVNEIEASESVKDKEIETTDDTKEQEKSRSSLKKSAKVEYVKNKQNRNAAFESLLDLDENREGSAANVRKNDVKENKSNNAIPFVIPPENMFKPKTDKCAKNASTNNIVNATKVNKPGVFVPSSEAQEYYEKVMEKKRQKELREENIWTRAERQMKEIEAKRKKSNVVT